MFSKLALTLFSFIIISATPLQQVTLIDVDANLEVVFLDRLDPGAKKTQNRYFENKIAHRSMELLSKELQETLSLNLKIDNSIEQHIDIDDHGYPNPLIIKSAIKKLSKNEIQLAPYLQLVSNFRIEGDALGKNDMLQRIQPNIEIIIKVFGNDGKLITKSSTTSILDGFINNDEFGESVFNKSDQGHIDLMINKIDALLKEGITRATKRLKL